MTGNRVGTIADYRPALVYVQANFGRNVGDEPMSDDQWNLFRADVQVAFGVRTEAHFGQGTYDGVTEDSCHVSGFVLGGRVEALEAELAALAAEYGQDSIALIVGSRLIKAAR